MATGWFLTPCKWRKSGPKDTRYVAMNDFNSDIFSADGDWTEIEIDNDLALVKVRAPKKVLDKIALGSDVQIKLIDNPIDYWKPTRISTINGVEYNTRKLEDVDEYFQDDQEWGDIKKVAEDLAKESDKMEHLKIDRGDWRKTSQLLVLLGKAGYKLDKISTGTFPTTGVLDTFDRANATTVGAGWTELYAYLGSGDWGITSNQLYNPDGGAYVAMYYNASTYGADSEAYISVPTLAGDLIDSLSLFLRAKDPGTNFDSYALNYLWATTGSPKQTWNCEITTNHVGAVIGAEVEQAIAAGDKVGAEIIGYTIVGYRYTGGAWAAVLSRTDAGSTWGAAGYIGTYLTVSALMRLDDFGGGTVITGGTVEPISVQAIG